MKSNGIACSFGDCEENWTWKFTGEFEVNDVFTDVLYLCQTHYEKFLEVAPLEMLQLLMDSMPETGGENDEDENSGE